MGLVFVNIINDNNTGICWCWKQNLTLFVWSLRTRSPSHLISPVQTSLAFSSSLQYNWPPTLLLTYSQLTDHLPTPLSLSPTFSPFNLVFSVQTAFVLLILTPPEQGFIWYAQIFLTYIPITTVPTLHSFITLLRLTNMLSAYQSLSHFPSNWYLRRETSASSSQR